MGPGYSTRKTGCFLIATEVRGKNCFPGWSNGFFLLTECLLPSLTFSWQKKPLPTSSSCVWVTCPRNLFWTPHPLTSADPKGQQASFIHGLWGSCSISLPWLSNPSALRWTGLVASFQPLEPNLTLLGGKRTDPLLYIYNRWDFLILEISLLNFHFSTTFSYFLIITFSLP